VTLRNGVMVHEANVPDPADVTVTLPRAAFLATLAGQPLARPPQIEGRAELLPLFLSLFETPPADFPVVTP
jgi:alkyl sulfatase BDS1-like metallo-beta-lactamase superfamily hydrolase